nr:MAG TPA: hypothetical protein [Caudoviricetes sp.]
MGGTSPSPAPPKPRRRPKLWPSSTASKPQTHRRSTLP